MEQQNNKTDCRFDCNFYDWTVGTCGGECVTLRKDEQKEQFDNIPHTSEKVYQIMREDEFWTKDELVNYLIELEKLVSEWWEEKKKEYVKVVRCKDCEFCWKNGGDCVSDPDWFCADGKRKDG